MGLLPAHGRWLREPQLRPGATSAAAALSGHPSHRRGRVGALGVGCRVQRSVGRWASRGDPDSSGNTSLAKAGQGPASSVAERGGAYPAASCYGVGTVLFGGPVGSHCRLRVDLGTLGRPRQRCGRSAVYLPLYSPLRMDVVRLALGRRCVFVWPLGHASVASRGLEHAAVGGPSSRRRAFGRKPSPNSPFATSAPSIPPAPPPLTVAHVLPAGRPTRHYRRSRVARAPPNGRTSPLRVPRDWERWHSRLPTNRCASSGWGRPRSHESA